MSKTTRVQLELPDQSFKRLKQLRIKTEAASYAEVMRNALRLYEAMIEEVEQGNSVYIERDGGGTTPIKLIV